MRVTVSVVLALVLAAQASALHSQKASRHSGPRRSAAPAFDPKAYATSIAGVDCSNVLSRYRGIIPFERVARNILQKGQSAIPAKSEFETSTTFQDRAQAIYRSYLGGTDKVVAAIPLPAYHLTYDADKATMQVVAYRRDYDSRGLSTSPFGDFAANVFSVDGQGGAYTASNAYGATVRVDKTTVTNAAIQFDLNGQYERNVGTLAEAKYTLQMQPDVARLFKNNGMMLVVGTARFPFVSREYVHSAPTISDPSDFTSITYGLRIAPQCIIFAHDGIEDGRVAID